VRGDNDGSVAEGLQLLKQASFSLLYAHAAPIRGRLHHHHCPKSLKVFDLPRVFLPTLHD
jgi:hypothetical protein